MNKPNRGSLLTALGVMLDSHGIELENILMREQLQKLDFSECRNRELESMLAVRRLDTV